MSVDTSSLIACSAREVVRLLRTRRVSAREVLQASYDRIAQVDGLINALPILCQERAFAVADSIDSGGGAERSHHGWLAGLPIAIKDLNHVGGVRTTFCCPVYRDNVAAESEPQVEVLERRGAVVVGKSNSPEFGFLPVTSNNVHGVTLNPYDRRLSPGGSSGGAAAALATGQVWLAQGNDIGGSLRIPAALTGVCGLRPTPGRVPRPYNKRLTSPLAVQGPMARTVADTALFLDAMAAFWPHDPLSLPVPERSFLAAVDAPTVPLRIAYAPDLGFGAPDPEVAAVLEEVVKRIAALGVAVEFARPDFTDADRVYQILVAIDIKKEHEIFIRERASEIEPLQSEVLAFADTLTVDDVLWAERRRAEIIRDFAAFTSEHGFLLTPTVGIAAPPADERGTPRIDGWVSAGPPAWFHPTWSTVLTTAPALSMPAGFTPGGLPVGLQILGPFRGEAEILSFGAVVESLLNLPTARPINPRPLGI